MTLRCSPHPENLPLRQLNKGFGAYVFLVNGAVQREKTKINVRGTPTTFGVFGSHSPLDQPAAFNKALTPGALDLPGLRRSAAF